MNSAEFVRILESGDEAKIAAAKAELIAGLNRRTVAFGKAPAGGWTEADRVS